jgi:putative transposase
MPPAFRNHLVPTACDTPASTAASSLAMPTAIAAQNRRRSSRPATDGRPGDDNGARPHRSERRLCLFIATSFVKVLRRPLESTQYAAHDYRVALAAAGMTASMSRKADCFDNAPMESFFHTLKTELVHHRQYATRAEAQRDIFAFIEGFYNRTRLHSAIGYISPIEMELKAA